MPTENRSSNTELMVTARVCAYTPGQSKVELQLIPPSALPSWLELGQQVIARPAALHQGEPTAWMDEDGALHATLESAEFSRRPVTPLYRHPPTSDGFSAGDMADQGAKAFAARDGYVHELRAKLAEAQEVLRDCIEVGELDAETQWKAERVSKGRRLYVDDRALSVSSEQQPGNDWHMNPCKKGHRDVGACNGKAFCHQCDEMITATTTQEAFEQWNATHPASDAQNPTE